MIGLMGASTVPSAITPLTVTAMSGTLTHTTQVTLTTGTQPDYSIATSTQALSIVPGSTQTMTVTATAANGFSGSVDVFAERLAGRYLGRQPASHYRWEHRLRLRL